MDLLRKRNRTGSLSSWLQSSRSKLMLTIRIVLAVVLLIFATTSGASNTNAQIIAARESYRAGDLDGALQRLEPLLKAEDLDQPTTTAHARTGRPHITIARRKALSPDANSGINRRLRSTNQIAARPCGRALATRHCLLLRRRVRKRSATVRASPNCKPAGCRECGMAFFMRRALAKRIG